jgi:hypothetical protein
LCAQVHDITEREIEAFSYGILAKWQFHDFYKENPRSNEEFKRTVEKMIAAEEKNRKRFLDPNNQNNFDRRNHQSNEQQGRKCRFDNTVAIADKAKKFFKPRKFEDLENMPYIWHLGSSHTTGNCRFFIEQYMRKDNKGDRKEDHQKKDDDDQRDKGFQNSQGDSSSDLR